MGDGPQARIGAANAYRKDGDTTIFDHGVFTPCKPCETDPEKAKRLQNQFRFYPYAQRDNPPILRLPVNPNDKVQ